MHAEIIAIGTELTTGAKLDTNSQWLSLELQAAGIPVHFHVTVADDLDANVNVLRSAVERSNLILISGGLGPTLDDLTRDALARLTGTKLVLHEPSLEVIRGMFARRGRAMPERNIVQAMFPGVVKRVFPGHVAKVMGLYSAMLMSGGALGAKASPIIAGHAGSWHLGLAWLALPAGLAVLLAAVYLPANEQSESRRKRDDGAVETAARLAAHAVLRSRQWRLFHRHRLAVAVLSGARMGRDRERQPAGGHGHLSGNLRSYPAAVHRTDG